MQPGQVERGGRGGLQWRSIRPEEGQHTVEPTSHAESTFVDGAVVAPAQKHEVVEGRGAAIDPTGVPGARGLRAGVE